MSLSRPGPVRGSDPCRGFLRRAWPVPLLILAASAAQAQVFEAVGTRAQGMGGAFVAVADDASAVYWNPAGLAMGPLADLQWDLRVGETVATPAEPLGPGDRAWEGNTNLIAFGMPALGLAYYRLREAGASAAAPTVEGSGDRESEGGNGLDLDRLATDNFGVSLLQSIADWAVIGVTVRVVRGLVARGTAARATLPGSALDLAEGMTGVARTTGDLDAGAMVALGVVRAGIVARNLTEPTFEPEPGAARIRLNRQVRVGVAVAPRSRPTGTHGPLTVSVDADLTRNESPAGQRRDVAAGAEGWWAGGRVGARAGVRTNTLEPHRWVVSTGASVTVRSSMFVDGQMTWGQSSADNSWGLAARVTF
jgi:hypothetical protein